MKPQRTKPTEYRYIDENLQDLDFTLTGPAVPKFTPRRALLERAINLFGFAMPFVALAMVRDYRPSVIFGVYGESATEAIASQFTLSEALDFALGLAFLVVPLASVSPRIARAGLLPMAILVIMIILGFIAVDFATFWWIRQELMYVVLAFVCCALMLGMLYLLALLVRKTFDAFRIYELKHTHFERCTIERCDFGGSYLADSKFVDCQFAGCRWRWATLTHALISDCIFQRCWFWVNTFGPETFSGCKLRDCVIILSSFEDPNFFSDWSGTMIRTKSVVWYARGG